jgi:hypothetical protein
VAADAIDAIDQPQSIDGAAAFDDLETIVHDLCNPGSMQVPARLATTAEENERNLLEF